MRFLTKVFVVIILTSQLNTEIKGQQITVFAGVYSRYQTIIEVTLQKPVSNKSLYEVKNMATGAKAPVEVKDGKRVLFILPDSIRAGDSARYQLIKATKKGASTVTISKKYNGLLVSVNKKPLLFYHTLTFLLPADSPAYYARSGFIHPLYSPGGSVLTDDFPVGHMHQHGVMMAWVNTRFKNKAVDFWNQHLQTGNVKHVAVKAIEHNNVTATLRVQLQHYSKQFGKILDELWTITIYPFSDHFLFDIQSSQTNNSNDTLFLNRYHYGGLSFRGSRQWNPYDTLHYKTQWQIQTDSGFNLSNADGKHAAYVTASGLIDGSAAGITVFNFPSNFRYPQAVRVHPTMPYWCYAPVADGAFNIAPQHTYSSGYRYLLTGQPELKETERVYHDLINPVLVRVL